MIASRLAASVRNLFTSAVRRSGGHGHDHGGVAGQNLPFNIHNRYTLTALFILFFGSGVGAPYLIVRHQLLKK